MGEEFGGSCAGRPGAVQADDGCAVFTSSASLLNTLVNDKREEKKN